MNRRELLAACGSLTTFAAAGCNEAGDGTPTETRELAVDEVDDWPMFLYDSTHGRCFAGERGLEDAPPTRWSYGTDDAVWASPVIADGTLYVGSYDGYLYAISTETGDLLWRYETGDRLDGSPAVANGTVYFGSFDRNVYALDAESGDERWIYGMDGIVRSSPTVSDGVVYVGAHCRTEECSSYYDARWPERGYVYALDAERGDLRWRHGTGDGVVSTPAVRAGTVYVGSSDETLYALDAETGEKRWSHGTEGAIMSSPAVVDGRVYFGTVVGELYALDADGEVAWRFDAERSGNLDLPVVITCSPVVCDGTVYVGSVVPGENTYGELYAISADEGTREWAASPYGHGIGSSPVIVDDALYFGAHTLGVDPDAEPGLYAVDQDGTDRWSYTVDGAEHRGFGSSPAVVGETLYVGSTAGQVHAFDLER